VHFYFCFRNALGDAGPHDCRLGHHRRIPCRTSPCRRRSAHHLRSQEVCNGNSHVYEPDYRVLCRYRQGTRNLKVFGECAY
jgi:hypothetical protein